MKLIEKTISECLEERAAQSPKDIFLRYNDETFSWRCVDMVTRQMALLLYDKGVRNGDMVGLMGVNSASWVISFLALQKLGAGTVLINSHYKESELMDCIEMTEMKHLLFTFPGEDKSEYMDSLRNNVRSGNLNIMCIDKTFSEWKSLSCDHLYKHRDFPKPHRNPHDTSIILFTSGTTNSCKGVKLSHYSIINNALEVAHLMKWSDQDKLCLTVPLFHCFGVTVSLLTSILCGMELVILEKYRTVEVCRNVQDYGCTVLNGVPSMFLAMTRNKRFKDFDLTGLKSGLIAGSPIYPEEYKKVCSLLPNMKLQTSYGLTEASPCISLAEYDDDIDKKSISAGKIIDNVTVKIVNLSTGDVCKTGEAGEIFVKGYNVTSGYLSNDPVVCDAVRPDGWLKTGDLGYLDSEGYLYIVGRRKNLIIRGGENISPNEIEEYIMRVQQDTDVKVIGIKSDVIQEEIVACIEAERDEEKLKQTIEYLKDNLSAYKMPEHFIYFDEFPRNPTGKINEKELRKIVLERLGK